MKETVLVVRADQDHTQETGITQIVVIVAIAKELFPLEGTIHPIGEIIEETAIDHSTIGGIIQGQVPTVADVDIGIAGNIIFKSLIRYESVFIDKM